MNSHQIRAIYNEQTIRVYQAYSPEIAHPALAAGRFVSPFKMERMTWIKPSFNWMMYRSGYGKKPGQEVVLGIDILREGFEWALEHAVLSHFVPSVHGTEAAWKQQVSDSPVRIQWDPERTCRLEPIAGVRSLQMGLSGKAVQLYVPEWTVSIEDVTPAAHRLAEARDCAKGGGGWPHQLEQVYPLPEKLRARLGLQAEDTL